MATKVDFKTLLMKLVNVFPKDIYLVRNWCVVAGAESELENRGFYFCILEPDVREMLSKTFPNNPVLYIKSVRETKADLSKIQEVIDEKIIKGIDSVVNYHTEEMNKVTEWNMFNFNDDEITTLFTDGDSLTLFENDDNKSPVIISKSLFPLINEKSINTVKYSHNHYEGDFILDQVIMVYDYELFQLIMRYLYVKI